MKGYLFIFFVSLFVFSCTKEKDIPFQDSIKDTINHTYYHDISGQYNGNISDIEFVSSNSYIELRKAKHNMVVSENDFDNVLLENISDRISGNAEARMYRINQSGGYLSFYPGTMPDSTGVDTLFQGQYNGIYYYGNGSLQYFFFYVKGKDTTHQMFQGNRL